MRSLRCLLLPLLLLPFPMGAQPVPSTEPDVVMRAMADELERTQARLRLGELEAPYFVAYHAADVEEAKYVASFGAVVGASQARQRYLWAEVRVGDYDFDNSYFVDLSSFGGFRASGGTTTIDDNYQTLRQDLWLLTDGAYKTALEQLAQKRAYVQGQRKESEVADFSREEPVVFLQSKAQLKKGTRNWEQEIKDYSRLCKAEASVEKCDVSVSLKATTRYLANSEGTRVRWGENTVAFEAVAVAMTADGHRVNNFLTAYGRTPEDLPPPAALHQQMEEMLKELEALRQAEPVEHYNGPVLVEASAAAPLLNVLLAGELDGGNPPQGQLEMMLQGELQNRLNTRILPEFLDLVDDPTQRTFNGESLSGSYEVDDEGVRAQRVVLVQDGTLQNWLMSRRPGKDASHSNGHGRGGISGQAAGRPANLFLESDDSKPVEQLEEEFLSLCREEGRAFCVEIRKMNDPSLIPPSQASVRGMQAMMARMMSGGGKQAPVLEAYKVYPEDGRRELARGIVVSGLRIRTLRDIAAVGEDYTVHNFQQLSLGGGGFLDRFLGMFGAGRGSGVIGLPTAFVTPSLLFEELEVQEAPEEPEKAQVIPRPVLSAENE